MVTYSPDKGALISQEQFSREGDSLELASTSPDSRQRKAPCSGRGPGEGARVHTKCISRYLYGSALGLSWCSRPWLHTHGSPPPKNWNVFMPLKNTAIPTWLLNAVCCVIHALVFNNSLYPFLNLCFIGSVKNEIEDAWIFFLGMCIIWFHETKSGHFSKTITNTVRQSQAAR